MEATDGEAPALPSPLRGGAGGGGRAAAPTAKVKPIPWEREASALATARTKAAAQLLRRRLTPPERRLWWHLRHTLGLTGTHFRRQVAIGKYVTDFCCLSCRLIVEVDGEQHGSEANIRRDAERTLALEAVGFRVLRFSNRDVMRDMTVVLDTILAACGPTPPTPVRSFASARPSPQGGGKGAADEPSR